MVAFRISRSLSAVLVLIVGLAALLGHAWLGVGVAFFVFVLTCMDAKPAWRWFFDPPGHVDSGRSGGRFYSWRRFGEGSPRERFPRHRS